MTMKVKDLFTIPSFHDLKLLAGQNGVSRKIENINMMDAPDIIDFLKPNDLLVTTGYHLQNHPSALIELVHKMNDRGCSAIGIKTKRFLHDIPREVITLANDLSFPIIEIPLDISLVEIVNDTLSSILEMRTNELRYAIEVHQTFTNHILHGKGLQKLLENLSSMIGYSTWLVNPYFKPLAASAIKQTDTSLNQALEKVFFNEHQFLSPKSPFTVFSLLQAQTAYTVFPILTYQDFSCFLVIAGEISPNDRSLVLTIEQATNVIAFELMKENALKQYSIRAKNEFFNNFTEDKFTSTKEIMNRAKEFQIQNDQKFICVTGKLDVKEEYVSFTQKQLEANYVYDFLESELSDTPFQSHLFLKGEIIVLLFESNEQMHQNDVTPFLMILQKKIRKLFNRTISFGISNECQQFLETRIAYKEAIDALNTGFRANIHEFIRVHQTKDIEEILRLVPTADLLEFYQHTLKVLSEPGGGEDEQVLLNTLFVYLEAHCQISETAKRLYVHRNTVIYRLEKCENLLHISLKDPEVTFRLRFALRIRELLNLASYPNIAASNE